MDSRPLPTHWPEAGQLGPASQRKVHPNRNLKLQMRESPSRLGNAISQITTLFPPFSFPFLFWMRFKKVHRNQDCFGSKSSRGRGSVVGARKRTKSPLANLSLVLWARAPAHGPAGLPGQPEASEQPALSLAARHLARVTLGPATKTAPGQRASQSSPPTPAPCPGLSLAVLQPKSGWYHRGAGRRGELTQPHSHRWRN